MENVSADQYSRLVRDSALAELMGKIDAMLEFRESRFSDIVEINQQFQQRDDAERPPMARTTAEQTLPMILRNLSTLCVAEDVCIEDRDRASGRHYLEAYWQLSRREVNCLVRYEFGTATAF